MSFKSVTPILIDNFKLSNKHVEVVRICLLVIIEPIHCCIQVFSTKYPIETSQGWFSIRILYAIDSVRPASFLGSPQTKVKFSKL